jgi:hypothetical protein
VCHDQLRGLACNDVQVGCTMGMLFVAWVF